MCEMLFEINYTVSQFLSEKDQLFLNNFSNAYKYFT